MNSEEEVEEGEGAALINAGNQVQDLIRCFVGPTALFPLLLLLLAPRLKRELKRLRHREEVLVSLGSSVPDLGTEY